MSGSQSAASITAVLAGRLTTHRRGRRVMIVVSSVMVGLPPRARSSQMPLVLMPAGAGAASFAIAVLTAADLARRPARQAMKPRDNGFSA
jgi:hypothetical protein